MHPSAKEFYRTMGDFIARRRRFLDLSQQDLAVKVGITRAALANIETGRQRIHAHQLAQLAISLELSVTDLIAAGQSESEPEESTDLPLPEDLTPHQRQQITKLLLNTTANLTTKDKKK